MHSTSEEGPESERAKLKKRDKKKSTQDHIPLLTFDRRKMDPPMEVQPQQAIDEIISICDNYMLFLPWNNLVSIRNCP